MRLQDIMNKKVERVSPKTSADRAWDKMQMREIHHLVVMENGRVIGVVSQRDLGGRRGASVRRGRTVADLMTPHAVTAKSDATVKRAANLMRGHIIGCLPVVDEGKLKGIITVADLLDLWGRGGLDRTATRAERAKIRHRAGRTKGGA